MKKEIILPIILITAFLLALLMHYTWVDLLVHQYVDIFCTDNCALASDWITHIGDGWLQVILCCIMGIIYYTKTNYVTSRLWFYAAPISLLAGAMGQIIKFTFGRPRPKLLPELYDFQWFEVAGALRGFPSGHTLTSFAIVAVVASQYNAKGKIILFALACVAGLSRITTNSHFIADVVFGAALGYFFGIVLKNILIKVK
jgi:membrane-associated phospholipid phosphatase